MVAKKSDSYTKMFIHYFIRSEVGVIVGWVTEGLPFRSRVLPLENVSYFKCNILHAFWCI